MINLSRPGAFGVAALLSILLILILALTANALAPRGDAVPTSDASTLIPGSTAQAALPSATAMPSSVTPIPPVDTPTPTLPPPVDTLTPTLPPTVATSTPISPTAEALVHGPSNLASGSAWVHIYPQIRVGQSFKSISTHIHALEVNITPVNSGSGDTITILLLDGETELYKESRLVEPGFDGWLHFDLPNGGIDVTPGKTYRIQLSDTEKTVIGWRFTSNTYPDGTAFWNGAAEPESDRAFKVNP